MLHYTITTILKCLLSKDFQNYANSLFLFMFQPIYFVFWGFLLSRFPLKTSNQPYKLALFLFLSLSLSLSLSLFSLINLLGLFNARDILLEEQ